MKAEEIPKGALASRFANRANYTQDIGDLEAISWPHQLHHFEQQSLLEGATPKELLASLGEKLLSYVKQLGQTDGVSIPLFVNGLSKF